MKRNKISYSLYNPSGNITAIVDGLVPSRARRKEINDQILQRNSVVEQVGFAEFDAFPYTKGIMAGLEFCANFTATLAWLKLKGKSGKVTLNVSGADFPVQAGVDDTGFAWTEIPIAKDSKLVREIREFTSVQLKGITHVLVQDSDEFTNSERKGFAFNILKDLYLTRTCKAAGIIFCTKIEKNVYSIRPIVWVRDEQTFVYEQACGSGSAALGIALSLKEQRSLTLLVLQPSGSSIEVEVQMSLGKIESCVIKGRVTKLCGPLYL